ncbi:MAG: bacteriohemerythrin [Gammaproteobacteria bacterium]|nr:bacteriohemerythrin [Gammaproteobacteria bacterium]MDH5801384.1 bacteriohemerythrin [Gammaproteobacteria bacterium]
MSKFVEWDQSLDVKVGDMNNEHKIWINYINALHDEAAKKSSSSVVMRAFDAMLDYTVKHFGDEEEFLQKIGYPLFDEHKQAHEDFLAEIRSSQRALSSKGELERNFFADLKGWLVRHIKIVDTQYGNYTERMNKKAG